MSVSLTTAPVPDVTFASRKFQKTSYIPNLLSYLFLPLHLQYIILKLLVLFLKFLNLVGCVFEDFTLVGTVAEAGGIK